MCLNQSNETCVLMDSCPLREYTNTRCPHSGLSYAPLVGAAGVNCIELPSCAKMFSNFRLLLGLLKLPGILPSRSFTVSLIMIPCCAGITCGGNSRLVSSESSLPVMLRPF
ncbi:hypothetical protein DERF_009869 [Dermatophagoides farinae]|uniref:Uncharacterized protein n=1 Tax=Dermatophagoides farinae TaxID=6954 RepID=A0A922L1C9_DERFA|nr:hypothetical protein DERF_009869 [Dermatophagoides farinae]